jgi:hypothetical protein
MYSSETKIEISLETEKELHYPIFLFGLPNCIIYRKEDGRQELTSVQVWENKSDEKNLTKS